MIRLLSAVIYWLAPSPLPRWEIAEMLGGPEDGELYWIRMDLETDTLAEIHGHSYRLEWRLVCGELRKRWVHLGVAEASFVS
jgi:hypothetical protein